MRAEFDYSDLKSDRNWDDLRKDLDRNGESRVLPQLLRTFRECGAVQCLEETAYIDRDFSDAFANFYSTLYRQRPRFCRRIHFFAVDVGPALSAPTKGETARELEAATEHYLGHIVIRPLGHAPVGSAIVSTSHFEKPGTEIAVRSDFRVHVLGAELVVKGVPVTEQDKRTGACAQATIWTAGRHFHNRYAMPWFSITDITEAALTPTDSFLARSLPAGSDYLTDDNMVRALRAMGEFPIFYGSDGETGWDEHPRRKITRYLDSGIPVIVGLRRGEGVGHAVIAVGTRLGGTHAGSSPKYGATTGDRVEHILVHDDQRGVYLPLAVGKQSTSNAAPCGEDRGPDDYTLDDALFLIVPLPNKVFIKAEVAETLARDKVSRVAKNRAQHLRDEHPGLSLEDWAVDPAFYATAANDLVARTYLTLGWKYKRRLMRNMVDEELKNEVSGMQLPRYVWVTEFSLKDDVADTDPCRRRVRSHVLIDATGSGYEDPVLVTHLPGIILAETFDPAEPGSPTRTKLHVLLEDAPYFPKVRGWGDYDTCAVDPAPGPTAANDGDLKAA
ncbi:hypothetical protein [Sphingomonas sp. RIT328]|uniref:hypothetical protein n=1 Tax=Sphingomonas sp. RIT328 TaxID=1470591 RepID=UPI00044CA6D8|nr:hypothetical protein [Sphingomonas sp. RIT328]EZP49948.1 hypothetical protein BW41_03273 [Sphingomonas sp. RIT328]